MPMADQNISATTTGKDLIITTCCKKFHKKACFFKQAVDSSQRFRINNQTTALFEKLQKQTPLQ